MTTQATFDTAIDELLTRGERPDQIEEILQDEDTDLVHRIHVAYRRACLGEQYVDENFEATLRVGLRRVASDWGLALPCREW